LKHFKAKCLRLNFNHQVRKIMKLNRCKFIIAAPVAALLMLSACGGGGEDNGTDLMAASQKSEVATVPNEPQSTQSEVDSVNEIVLVKDPDSDTFTVVLPELAAASDESRFALKAQSVSATQGDLSADEIISFIQGKYLPYLREAITVEIYLAYYYHRHFNPNLKLREYTFNTLKTDSAAVTDAYNKLPVAARTDVQKSAIQIASYAVDYHRAPGSARPYTAAELKRVANSVSRLSDDTVNRYKQHRAMHLDMITMFVETADQARHKNWENKLVTLEASDDKRYLKGATEDRLVEGKDFFGRSNNTLTVELGNKTQIVERAELVNTRSGFWGWLLGPKYDATSVIQHGKNSTATEKLPYHLFAHTTSEGFELGPDQTAGIDYYVDEHIKKNGAFPNMTEEESKRNLRGAITFISKDTGAVYESYVATQYGLRSAGQVVTALLRWAIDKKKINLATIQASAEARLAAESTWLDARATMQTRLNVGLSALIGVAVGQILMSAIAIDESNKILDENTKNNKTTTKEQDLQRVLNRMGISTTSANAAFNFAAIGILGAVAYVRQDEAKTQGPYINHWLGAGFAANDMAASIIDIVTLVRSRSLTTPKGFTTLGAALTRGVGASYTFLGYFHKLTNYRYGGTFTKNLTPLTFTTWTAVASAAIYGFTAFMASLPGPWV